MYRVMMIKLGYINIVDFMIFSVEVVVLEFGYIGDIVILFFFWI